MISRVNKDCVEQVFCYRQVGYLEHDHLQNTSKHNLGTRFLLNAESKSWKKCFFENCAEEILIEKDKSGEYYIQRAC